jgi:hypothetical protein
MQFESKKIDRIAFAIRNTRFAWQYASAFANAEMVGLG